MARDKKVKVSEAKKKIEELSPKRQTEIQQARGQEAIRQREKMLSRGVTKGAANEAIGAEDIANARAKAEAIAAEERKQAFSKASGSGETLTEIEKLLNEAPDLRADKKEVAGGVVGGLDLPLPPGAAGIGSLVQPPELLTDTKKSLLKTGVAFGVAGGLSTLPATAPAMIKGLILGTKGAIGGAVIALGSLMVGGKFTNIEGGEMGTLRAEVGKIPSIASSIQSGVQAGSDPVEAIAQLQDLHQSIINAERRIKELSIYNAKYQVDNKYRADVMLMRDSRTNIQERIRNIQTLAATGSITPPQEQLLYNGGVE